ncbi:hypothetical protein GCM10010402_05910 [Actinomadura luteofluorescens]
MGFGGCNTVTGLTSSCLQKNGLSHGTQIELDADVELGLVHVRAERDGRTTGAVTYVKDDAGRDVTLPGSYQFL